MPWSRSTGASTKPPFRLAKEGDSSATWEYTAWSSLAEGLCVRPWTNNLAGSDTEGANVSGAGCVDGEPFARGADGPDAWG